MDENELLEECISINFTPLETILLSKTLIVVHTLLKFLQTNNCMEIDQVTNDNTIVPNSEHLGNVLITSALKTLKETQSKCWENGKDKIGEIVPEEFNEIVDVYTTAITQIAYVFVEALRERDN